MATLAASNTTFITNVSRFLSHGIHFPQCKVQAETGINMLRIYNPIKNSYEHDSEVNSLENGFQN
jgi:deoxyribodipyrimidine photo-lyase